MPKIDIDDELYAHLLKNVQYLGEDGASILRRLLGFPPGTGSKTAPEADGAALNDPASKGLAEFLEGRAFAAGRTTVNRYLAILGEAYRLRGDSFDVVERINGSKRIYFAKSQKTIAESGKSTNPQKIPGSPFWALTNAPNEQKQALLRRVLSLLNFDENVVERCVAAIVSKN